MWIPGSDSNKKETQNEIQQELSECREALARISEKMLDRNFDDLNESETRKLKKFIRNIKSSSALLDLVQSKDESAEVLIDSLYKVFFGKSSDSSADVSKRNYRRGYAEDFYIKLDKETIESLQKRFVEGEIVKGSISFEEAIKKGTTDIGWISSFNGISRKDLKEIYSIDAKFPSGKRRRGKGETLSCLSFGGYINNERGADVFIKENRVEVKSTISASITSEDNLVSPKIKQFINLSYSISGKSKRREKTYGKRSFNLLLSKIETNPRKASEFWKRFHQIVGFKTERDPKKISSILISLQIEHYSRPENFNMMVIFSENASGSPDSLSVLVKEESFVTERNIGILSDLNIYFRVYPNKVEIFL